MKTLGVIGGVGPLSTAYFMEVVINLTDASTDQQHIDMIVLNHTQIPDRTTYILDNSQPSPVEMMVADAVKLEQLGAEVIVTPCNTAHYFYNELNNSVGVTFINMIEQTAIELIQKNAKTVGILATNGTIQTRLFQDELIKHNIKPVVPSEKSQQLVMDIIYNNVKANLPIDMNNLDIILGELNHCDHIILGCTELSLLKRDTRFGELFVDSLEVLAKKTILECGAKCRII